MKPDDAELKKLLIDQANRLADLTKVALRKSDDLESSVSEMARTMNILRQETLAVMYRPTAEGSKADRNDETGYFAAYAKASRIREIYATDLFPGLADIAVPIGAINEESEHPNQIDLLLVSAIAQLRQARRMFEFGTYQGRTTYYLTFASEDAEVVTLNLPEEIDTSVEGFLGGWFKGTDRERFIKQLLCDSRALDTAPYARSRDFVFVDGDHSYELVENDTKKALEMLAPGGVLVWHDYSPKSPGVVRYLHDLSQTMPLFRIKHTCLAVYVDGLDVDSYQSPQRLRSWVTKS